MLEALSLTSKLYLKSDIIVEETGEHYITGFGEMFFDCLLCDIRAISRIEIRISCPTVNLKETVSDQSAFKT